MTMLLPLIVVVALLVLAMTVPLHDNSRPSMAATRPSMTLIAPSPSHGVLKQVFVPEEDIRSYMAAHKAVVHSSAPTTGGYIVNVAALNR